MKGIKLNTLENIEEVMPKLREMFEKESSGLFSGGAAVAPLAEAIETLARELRQLRDKCRGA